MTEKELLKELDLPRWECPECHCIVRYEPSEGDAVVCPCCLVEFMELVPDEPVVVTDEES